MTTLVLPVRFSVGVQQAGLVGYITCEDFTEVPALLRGLMDSVLSTFEEGVGELDDLRQWEVQMTEPDFGDNADEPVYDDDQRPEGDPPPAHDDDGSNPGLDELRPVELDEEERDGLA